MSLQKTKVYILIKNNPGISYDKIEAYLEMDLNSMIRELRDEKKIKKRYIEGSVHTCWEIEK